MRQRANVLILVIAILAVLFIIGAALLTLAHHERKSVQNVTEGRQMRAVLKALDEHIMDQLRQDIVGKNGIPYDRGWNNNN